MALNKHLYNSIKYSEKKLKNFISIITINLVFFKGAKNAKPVPLY